MQTKVLIIAVVQNGNDILMRKKPAGSPPYKETWYLFGAELNGNKSPQEALTDLVKSQSGVDITIGKKFSWDTEIKNDLDGVKKYFIYLDVLCDYVSGNLVPAEGIEKLEWVPKDQLEEYDLVPPSIEVFKKLGYL